MPTRRSMLKWIPAACFGGWCALRPASAASPAAPAQVPAPLFGKDSSSDYDSSRADCGSSRDTYTYTYHADGKLKSIHYPDSQSTYYEYSAIDIAASAAT